ncbi:MAG: hypothetical protein WEC54_04315 [Gemmatimonadales bacterium]
MTTRRAAPLALALLVLSACNEQRIGTGIERDQVAPVAQVIKTAGDTLTVTNGIQFAIGAADNLGIRSIAVTLSGGYTASFDTTFTSAVTTFQWDFTIPLPANTTAGGVIVITADVTDGNNNTAQAVDSVVLTNPAALNVVVLRPSPGAVSSAGLGVVVEIRATQRDGIQRVGYVTSGVVITADSVVFGSPYPDTALFVDTLTVPASTPVGNFQIVGFGVDSTGRRATSTPLIVSVQSVTSDTTAPNVNITVAARVEERDSIKVVATDPIGLTRVGWTGALTLAPGTVVAGDSVTVSANLTEATQTFNLNLNLAALPTNLILTGFAIDANGNDSRSPGKVVQGNVVDTVLVVFGITKRLPVGGRVADGIYNTNRDELYLTNVQLNRVEIFQISDTSFVPGGIPVGSQPWGIALWPRDTLGNNADSVMVGNSGGTDISVVDVAARRERRRHALPNFIVQSVQTEIDPATLFLKIKIIEFDFSDRPAYVGAVCLPTTGGTSCAPDSIYAVYSTTPTTFQGSEEFSRRGTMRWENLTAATPQSHFFWEQAEVPPGPDADTLQIIALRQNVTPDTVLSAACGITVSLIQVSFSDSTFVRNSGNFTHTLMGEGGVIEPVMGPARVVGHDVTDGIQQFACNATVAGVTFTGRVERDLGVTPAVEVRDFLSNTATPLSGIAVNFNGLTNVVRADSVYLLNEELRLKGIIGVPANSGTDLNFNHAFEAGIGGTAGTCCGTLDPNDRLIFLAAPDQQIIVYDTYFFGRVATFPIKDRVIGPLRVARLGSGEQLLIGVTANGVVTIRLPPIANIFPVSGWGVGQQ